MISIHALLAESDCSGRSNSSGIQTFLSTLSLRRATPFLRSDPMMRPYFYPRSPCGERRLFYRRCMQHAGFLSTLSLRRATPRYRKRALAQSFLSTLSLRRATFDEIQAGNIVIISIHALLAESDAVHIGPNVGRYDFYPRSPCGERPGPNERSFVLCQFLSTLSLRRATNVRPETRQRDAISIHALLAESDPGKVRVVEPGLVFLSTLSLRRATTPWFAWLAPRAYFYPRSPCGERQWDRNGYGKN